MSMVFEQCALIFPVLIWLVIVLVLCPLSHIAYPFFPLPRPTPFIKTPTSLVRICFRAWTVQPQRIPSHISSCLSSRLLLTFLDLVLLRICHRLAMVHVPSFRSVPYSVDFRFSLRPRYAPSSVIVVGSRLTRPSCVFSPQIIT